MQRNRLIALLLLALLIVACQGRQSPATTQDGEAAEAPPKKGKTLGSCGDLPNPAQLKQWLKEVPAQGEAGGLFSGRQEWAAVVDREGEVCAVAVATDDPAAAWPGSLAIAKAKAFTANAFSTDSAPMSTARLYTLSQPGHSLWGAGAANPFNPKCFAPPNDPLDGHPLCGGTIVFGGGVPLYKGETRVGGLGISGDTACADHEIAKRIRSAAKLDPALGATADDIQYSSADGPSQFTHPLCINTWRNGKQIGEEPVPQGY